MKIEFSKPIPEEDLIRTAIQVEQISVQPENEQVISSHKGGSSRNLPVSGFSDRMFKAYIEFISAFEEEVKAEYETGSVTARANAKLQLDVVSASPEKEQLP